MAKLGAFYSLCPIIDQHSLLGVHNDAVKGFVIVSLGKNIAIRYKFSDQKQIRSWSSKDKFTSPVVYDTDHGKYVSIFNQTYIRMWDEEEESLDKIAKYKFKVPLHTIVTCDDINIIVFKDCSICSIEHGLQIRQDFTNSNMLRDAILHVECVKIDSTHYVGLMIESKDTITYVWMRYIDGHLKRENGKKFLLTAKDSSEKIIGHFLHLSDYGPQLFTLWSNDKLYALNLNDDTDKSPGDLFSLITDGVSCKQAVTMMSLDKNYVAMYGANKNEEGATVLIYNLQFRVVQTQQCFKLFTQGAKLWRIDDRLLLCVGQNLAVVPFHLDTEQLAALVGSHKTKRYNSDPDITIVTDMVATTWTSTKNSKSYKLEERLPDNMKKQLQDLTKQGWSESAICEETLSQGVKDAGLLENYLTTFKDIPEKILAKLLKHAIDRDPTFLDTDRSSDKQNQHKLIDKIFSCSFSDIILLPYLRSYLTVDDALALLHYLCYLLGENGTTLSTLSVVESDKKIIAWGSTLLDAHYQHLLLSSDERVLNILRTFSATVNDHFAGIEELQNVMPLLIQLKQKKLLNKKCITSEKYSIEYLSLY